MKVYLDDDADRYRWHPRRGEQERSLRSRTRLPIEEYDRVVDSAVEVLAKCPDPSTTDPVARAGLVVGNVQSGKTANFTAVTALAHDNDVGIVVALLGTTRALLSQGEARLAHDLGFSRETGGATWVHISSSDLLGGIDAGVSRLRAAIQARSSNNKYLGRPTVVLTVMKERSHLSACADLLEFVRPDLKTQTCLMIDDEADQASMDISKVGDPASSTYASIRRIRRALPRHALLQYTATPQANLLASIADEVSPDFVQVLEPGEGYVGGRTFFIEEEGLVETIPHAEAEAATDASLSEPPSSLKRATATFLIGVAYGLVDRAEGRGGPDNRAMLIHPTHFTAPQTVIRNVVKQLVFDWKTLLSAGVSLTEDDDFVEGHRDLRPDEDPEEGLERLGEALEAALTMTQVVEVNGKADDAPQAWTQSYSWILVGGQLLDRGYTVEGLTVTYMPRGIGVGNADTLQQRGRFYGYKAHYLSYCRLWLSADTRKALTDYVKHEEVLRESLREVDDSGKSLRQWKREFVLSPDLQPTRESAIRIGLKAARRGRFETTRDVVALAQRPDDLVTWNAAADALASAGVSASLDAQGSANHHFRKVATARAIELLSHVPDMEGDDQLLWRSLLALQSGNYGDEALVVVINRGEERSRSLNSDGNRIKQLFEGRREGYGGDRTMKSKDMPTIQIHRVVLEPEQDSADVAFAGVVVPVFAVHFPRSGERVLRQA